jgi:DNA-binding CsgD family transcriptional regulator
VSEQTNITSFYQKELTQKELELAASRIVYEFCIKTVHFRVVAVESDREEGESNLEKRENEKKERQNAILSFFSNTLQASIIGQFEIDGNLYLIIKTKTPAQSITAKADPSLMNLLTGRELQVATLTASGRSNKQIANHLCISEWTVSAHLRRIFIKLNVDNRAAMAYRCAPLINQAAQMFE